MKRGPAILLILIVVLPLALLAWAGVRLSQHQRWQTEQQIRSLLTGRLRDVDRTVREHFAALAADLQQIIDVDQFDTEALRDIVRHDPRVFQLFVIDPEDVLIHPNPDGPLLQTERDFILRAAQVINDRQLQRIAQARQGDTDAGDRIVPVDHLDGRSKSADQPYNTIPAADEVDGWFAWYWGPGLNLIYWQRRASGHIVGVALERSRWIADLIADLPDTPSLAASGSSPPAELRIQLVEAGGESIYAWGGFAPPDTVTPAAEIRLSDPLAAWRLQVFAPLAAMTRSAGYGSYFNLAAGLTIAGVALMVLAVLFYQQYARDMREAVQRVSFVNQVSHELRTPLTNIRMYAELVETDLARSSDPPVEPQRRIGVIVAESERLSRLIDNVLTFARQEHETVKLSPRRCVVDDVIRKVLSRFQAGLDQQGIETETDLQAAAECLVDADALEQILGNLISNVEKYATPGKWMRIASRQQADRTLITVADRGPGIRTAHQKRVFEPFWRGSDDIIQTAGTGIGLAIARHLARLHGGDVTLLPTSAGAAFQLELATPPAKGDRQ